MIATNPLTTSELSFTIPIPVVINANRKYATKFIQIGRLTWSVEY